jgi:hypothetical protein
MNPHSQLEEWLRPMFGAHISNPGQGSLKIVKRGYLWRLVSGDGATYV